MLGGMRKLLDRYQKLLLVALAAVLMAVFAIPFRQMGGGKEPPIGSLYGHDITQSDVNSLARRWNALDDVRLFGYSPKHTYWLLIAAREHGVRVGSEAVDKMLAQSPPLQQRVEYVLADPDEIAKGLDPSDAELQAWYDRHWTDKDRPFDKVKDEVRRRLVKERAEQEARARIRRAHALVAAVPREGRAWRTALRDAATETGLVHKATGPFSQRYAADALADLVDVDPDAARMGTEPKLPENLDTLLFDIAVGKPSPVFHIGSRRFFFRVIESSAGFTADGRLVLSDFGWRYGRFVRTETYEDYSELLREKRRIDAAEARRTLEEFLTVKKFVALVCGGDDDTLFVTNDARRQFQRSYAKRVNALAAAIPLFPFFAQEPPAPEDVLEFYDARKRILDHPEHPDFGYQQPDRIQVEYVLADPKTFSDQASVSDDEAKAYYRQHKSDKFKADDGSVRPFDAVKPEIVRTLRSQKTHDLAYAKLDAVQKALREHGGSRPLPLDEPAAQVGLSVERSPFFAKHEARNAVPSLAKAEEFTRLAFSQELRPRDERGPRGTQRHLRPASPILDAEGVLFLFRVAALRPAHTVEYDALEPDEQQRVERDYRRWRAGIEAQDAARGVRLGIARRLLATLAAENNFAVKTAALVPLAEQPSELPPDVAEYLTDTLPRTPGAMARLLQDGDTCYTAVLTRPQQDTVHVEYIRFREDEFTAVVPPDEAEIARRARRIRDKAREKEDAETPDADPPPPTETQKEQARAELVEEWRQQPFKDRYRAVFIDRLASAFREYVETNPLEVRRNVQLDRYTSPHLHRDDPLHGDTELTEAVFELKPDTLSEPVAGESVAAVLLLADAPQERDEVNLEFVTVDPKQYNPLSAPVTEADAEAYYKAHREAFRQPARARAEFLFASHDAVAARLEPGISDSQIAEYYRKQRATAYPDRKLDDELRRTIRAELAKKQARAGATRKTLAAARAAAAAAPDQPLADAAAGPDRAPIVSGTTALLKPGDQTVQRVGRAPSLVRKILDAKPGELSPPVDVDHGWVLFRVTERVESSLPDFKNIAPLVRARVCEERLAARARAALEKARARLADGVVKTLAEALDDPALVAELPGPPRVAETGFVDRDRALDKPGMTAALRNEAFRTTAGKATPIVETSEGLQFGRVLAAAKNELRRVHYVPVPAELFAPLIKMNDAEVRKHYDEHKEDYRRGKRYDVESLEAPTWALERDIQPSDEEVRSAYEQLRGLFVDRQATTGAVPAYQPLDDVRDEVEERLRGLRASEKALDLMKTAREQIEKDVARPLEAVAKEVEGVRYKEPRTYEPGAEGNPFGLRDVAGLGAFLASAKAGATSPLLRGPSGPVLVRVKAVVPAGVPPFEDVAEQVREDAVAARALERAKEKAAEVRAAIETSDAAGMTAAARTFRIETTDRHKLSAIETGERARWEPFRRCRKLVVPTLFSMAPGEMTEPPVMDGEKAFECYLAALTEIVHRPLTPYQQAGLGDAAQRARQTRVLALLQTLAKAYQKTAPSR
jgi:hypothetical protein